MIMIDYVHVCQRQTFQDGVLDVLVLHHDTQCNTARNIARRLENCTICLPLKLLRATLRATVAEVESAPTSATSRATPYVLICNTACNFVAMLRTMMHRVSAPLYHRLLLLICCQNEIYVSRIGLCLLQLLPRMAGEGRRFRFPDFELARKGR